MKIWARQAESTVCRIVFHGAGPAGPGWANFSLVEAARKAGAVVFPPSAGLILPFLFARMRESPEVVSLFGYSLGAVSAVRLSRFLESKKIRVALLYLIDPIVLWGRNLRVPSSVERTFCCRQRNGARLRLLVGNFGRGAGCEGDRVPERWLEEEEAVRFPDGRPILHEDMVQYALNLARFPLSEALAWDPRGEEREKREEEALRLAGGIEQVPKLVSKDIQRPESPCEHSGGEYQKPPGRLDRVDGLGSVGQ